LINLTRQSFNYTINFSLLALDGELAPILVQMVKSANTNGLLDNDSMSAKWQNEVKLKLKEYLTEDKELSEDDKQKVGD
jgi:hypothetical protein